MIAYYLITFIQVFFGLLEWAVIIHVFYSWIRPHSTSFFYMVISSIVIPLYRLIRRIIPVLGPLDLTPLFALISIDIIGYLLTNLVIRLVS
jgi:YggT family protein